ncbi:hypothetical protein NEUTE1DRAFT_108102 [Neurospora tetrasperma FGSC 2508]|uniref:Mid2 domain-containing protein n=1 Tax=Neurospora tetrasperma (strain FGSC 2508 / ATCC MYA-4615 / P0657) TaxID=510951 RepID=F8MEN1_NEUT8|nr:uncharacterized protein NEUTE1DRAFT_108102 [Neurospora tetrasperma FGSC 2508]EGO61660.1 hypothetical protein NEUTE1DRAFT_108102 [Neurospora tetrasperma FGSC 2508]EGZ74290.1 hypothetical protein NEUTE2DRAFT_135669 [Neurospora tetrasperma FGSC 2509]
MEDNSDTSLPISKLVVARATASTMGSGIDQPKNLITPRAALTTSSATSHKARTIVTSTSVFVTIETETITFHQDGSVTHSSSPVPTTLVTTTTTTTTTNTAASPTPEETTGSAASNGGTQGPKSGVIAGALGGTIFGLLLIAILAFCLFRRRRLERQAQFYSAPTRFPAHRGTNFVRGSDGRVNRPENIPLASLGKSKQTRGEQDETADGTGGDERAPGQMRIEVVPAAEGDRGPRLRTVRASPASAPAPAPHQGRVLVPAPMSPLSSPVPASYPLLAPPAPTRPLRNVSSSVYSKPSQEDVASKFSEDSHEAVNNGNSSGNTVWPAPLFASASAQAAPAAAAGAPGPSSSTTTPHPEFQDRGGPSQKPAYVEPPSQSRWSPSTPTSDGSDEGLTARLGQQVAQVGEKLADKWKETKEKGWKGLMLGGSAAGSKEEKRPSKEEKGKGKAERAEIVVDPVKRGAPGWI